MVAGSLVLLRQRDGAIEFSPVNCGASVGQMAAEQHARTLLLDYFNASAPLERMYDEWSRCTRSAAAVECVLMCLPFAGLTLVSSNCRRSSLV